MGKIVPKGNWRTESKNNKSSVSTTARTSPNGFPTSSGCCSQALPFCHHPPPGTARHGHGPLRYDPAGVVENRRGSHADCFSRTPVRIRTFSQWCQAEPVRDSKFHPETRDAQGEERPISGKKKKVLQIKPVSPTAKRQPAANAAREPFKTPPQNDRLWGGQARCRLDFAEYVAIPFCPE